VTNATPALPSFSRYVAERYILSYQLTRRSQGATSTRSAPATSTTYSMSGMSQALPQVSYQTAAPNSRLSTGQYSQLASHPPRYPYDQSITSTVPTPSTRSTVYATHRQHASTDLDDLIYTDQQSIHISRLHHGTSAQDLQKLLSRSGTVSNLSIKRGKEKRCSATARYKTPAEAGQAIRDLNGRKVGKMTLVVRYDRSEAGSTSSAPSTTSKGSDSDSSTAKQMLARTGPLVVDGAKGPGYHKRCEDDDDSESTGDSSGDEGQTTGMLLSLCLCHALVRITDCFLAVKWPQGLLRQPTAKDGRR